MQSSRVQKRSARITRSRTAREKAAARAAVLSTADDELTDAQEKLKNDNRAIIKAYERIYFSDAPVTLPTLPSGWKSILTGSPEEIESRLRATFYYFQSRRAVMSQPRYEPNWKSMLGFSLQDLKTAGSIDMPHPQNSTLGKDVHPIFRLSQWRGINSAIYDLLKPALGLATKFITNHSASSIYFNTLLFGQYSQDDGASNDLGKLVERIQGADETTRTHRRVEKALTEFSRTGLVTWRFNQSATHQGEHTLDVHNKVWGWCTYIEPSWADVPSAARVNQAKTQESYKHWKRSIDRCEIPRTAYSLSLGCGLYNAFLTMLNTPVNNRNIEQQLRMNLMIAITMVHELAHALCADTLLKRAIQSWDVDESQQAGKRFSYYNPREASNLQGQKRFIFDFILEEPFFPNDFYREAGEAWENRLFGGKIAPINNEVDCRYGLAWEQTGQIQPIPEHCKTFAMPMKYVSRMQQDGFWKQSFDTIRNELRLAQNPTVGLGGRFIFPAHLKDIDALVDAADDSDIYRFGRFYLQCCAEVDGNSNFVPNTINLLTGTGLKGKLFQMSRTDLDNLMKTKVAEISQAKEHFEKQTDKDIKYTLALDHTKLFEDVVDIHREVLRRDALETYLGSIS